MRLYLTIIILCFASNTIYSQIGIGVNSEWRFMKGDAEGYDWSNRYFGTMGSVAEGNMPGARRGSLTWKDSAGNFWLFGGLGLGAVNTGYLNDLWKYDVATNQWIYIKGDNYPNVSGVYGIRGIEDYRNKPGARAGASGWVDTNGKLWMFGGIGYYTAGLGVLNDLWKYDPVTNNWTWIKGDNSRNVPGSYGVKNATHIGNNPGGRQFAAGWKDTNGNFWLFGGAGYAQATNGYLNDLWKYDQSLNAWTWVGGDSVINRSGSYPTLGQASVNSTPGGRYGSAAWYDGADLLYLFGGSGTLPQGFGSSNELWKYSISTATWTWLKGDSVQNKYGSYGTQGAPSDLVSPGSRNTALNWKDNAGNFWMFGGSGYAELTNGRLSDLFKYSPTTNQWTWVKGDKAATQPGIYGLRGEEGPSYKPGGRDLLAGWSDNGGNLWLIGGYGHHTNNAVVNMNDMWKFNINNNRWSWVSGKNEQNPAGIYGNIGFPAEGNKPLFRDGAVSWKDRAGNLWLFGGRDSYGTFNDLWKYNKVLKQWIWMKGGPNGNQAANYGTKGVANTTNTPGARYGSVAWTDSSGNFWLFGGIYSNNSKFLNDLWKFEPSTNNWTWMKGDNVENKLGVYGVIGVSADNNNPGSRHGATAWTDSTGILWLFGGIGYHNSGSGYLNDLWKYSVSSNQWLWVKGDSTGQKLGIYGTQVPSPTSKPGARRGAASWLDNFGNLWLHGGLGYGSVNNVGTLNDLWRYSPVTNIWTWMKGSDMVNQPSLYGTRQSGNSTTMPGARDRSVAWKDASGDLWMFGGFGKARLDTGFLNDVWRYNISSNIWTWMKGDSTVNPDVSPGIKGTPSVNNKPLGREYATGWVDNSGHFWMFGGSQQSFRTHGVLDDLWSYQPSTNVWTWEKGSTTWSPRGSFGVQGVSSRTNAPMGRRNAVTWTDTTGNLWLFGGSVYPLYGTQYYLNDLWKFDQKSSEWTWVKGDSMQNTFGRYGTKGIASATNKPGAREAAVSWLDNHGNFWLYGGVYNSLLYFNDLWKYSPSTNQWTWIKGDSLPMVIGPIRQQAYGIYGTRGISNASNKPGARCKAEGWKDKDGNLWLFGGEGNASLNSGSYHGGILNDLWKFNTGTNEWTWMRGDSMSERVAAHGTQLVPAASNDPGSRRGCVSWTDKDGSFWLFGGDNSGQSLNVLSDLWKYNTSTNLWTWMKGSNQANTVSAYATAGVESTGDIPGSRTDAFGWSGVDGNLYLFGGVGKTQNGANVMTAYFNDLWKFNPQTNNWTFFNGTTNAASTVIRPGARNRGATWADKFGNFWLLGGYGYGTVGNSELNDLWKIFSGSKYVFTGNGNWNIASNWANNLIAPTVITAGIDVTIDHLIPGACVNDGAITVDANGQLRVESGKRLTINQGDLLSSGDVIGPGNRPGRVNFTGAASNALRSTGSMSTPIVLENNKRLALTANSVTSRVELSGGSKLTLDKFHLDMDTATLVADASSFIITNDTGRLIRNVGTAPVTFHIGADSISYTPITVTNMGTEGQMRVNVSKGVPSNISPATTDNVDRTWRVSAVRAGANTSVTIQWNASDEQAGFTRSNAYIAQSHSCPLPPNCVDSYYDAVARTAANGTGPFTLTRNNVSNPTNFVVRSGYDVSRFTGNGTWDNDMNWTIGVTPSKIIPNGKEIIIDHPVGGSCNVTGDITIQRGGKLTVMPEKVLNVTGKIIVQN